MGMYFEGVCEGVGVHGSSNFSLGVPLINI
jgi:hypothetical protein